VDENALAGMITDLVNLSNNPQNSSYRSFFFRKSMISMVVNWFIYRYLPVHRCIEQEKLFMIAATAVILK
jgi:hypothetical protein